MRVVATENRIVARRNGDVITAENATDKLVIALLSGDEVLAVIPAFHLGVAKNARQEILTLQSTEEPDVRRRVRDVRRLIILRAPATEGLDMRTSREHVDVDVVHAILRAIDINFLDDVCVGENVNSMLAF